MFQGLIQKVIGKVRSLLWWSRFQASYSQCGEDCVVYFLLGALLKVEKIRYLDIGAHHPSFFSNTFFFYLRGSQGVCIEPNPELCSYIRKKRKRDICINAGIGSEKSVKMDFYAFTDPLLSTFSKEDADKQVGVGHVLKKVYNVGLLPINEILEKHFPSGVDFVSIDTEGFDEAILRSIDFSRHRPLVFCVETMDSVSFSKSGVITDFLKERGYDVYADTYLNTIYIDRAAWSARKPGVK
jgi:FkbM family methyltransferase